MAYTVQDWAKEKPLEYFVAQYLSHHLTLRVPDFHKEMYQAAYECAVLRKYDRLLIEAPRSFGKSYIFSLFLPLFLICTQEYPQLISFSRTQDLAKQFLMLIKRELTTNDLLRADFGVQPGDVWAKEEIMYTRPDGFVGQFAAKSKGVSPRGWHPQLAIIDDPQDYGDANSQTVVESDWDWYTRDFLGMMQINPVIFIGTRVGPICLVSQVARDPRYRHLKYSALDHNGKSIWPEWMDEKRLEEERVSMGDPAFKAEYMNEPEFSHNPIFKLDWVRWYDQNSPEFKKDEREGLYTVTYIDPAISKRDGADFTAIVTVSAVPGKVPRCYIREVKRGHWSMRDTISQAYITHERYQQRKTIVEQNAYQLALKENMEEEQRIRGRDIGVIGIRNDKDKYRRAEVVTPMVQGGQVYFAENDPMQQMLVDEMLMFSREDTNRVDDMVDALIGVLTDIKHENLGREVYEGPIITRGERAANGKLVIRNFVDVRRQQYAQQI